MAEILNIFKGFWNLQVSLRLYMYNVNQKRFTAVTNMYLQHVEQRSFLFPNYLFKTVIARASGTYTARRCSSEVVTHLI